VRQTVRPPRDIMASYRTMWIAPFTAAAALAALSLAEPGPLGLTPALAPAGFLLGLWFAAPAIAWWLSQPLVRREAKLTLDQRAFLRRIARKTWAFFDHFVVAEDHWLPPDNHQEDPGPTTAHRTSPTNIGLGLLANLSANDFGYITAGSLIERTANTFRTLASLERHRGHFYNWYDTRTLQPLPPRYISSVDSGNLAGHLLTLRAGLLALPGQKVVEPRLFDGLEDTLAVLTDTLPAGTLSAEAQGRVGALRDALADARRLQPAALPEALQRLIAVVGEMLPDAAVTAVGAAAEAAFWARAFQCQCQDALSELESLAPSLRLAPAPGDSGSLALWADMPTLLDLVETRPARLAAIDGQLQEPLTPQARGWLVELRNGVVLASDRAAARLAACEQLARQASALAAMEYEFLYDRGRHLLAIGYNVDELRRDSGFYDLLASEARLASFVAIAQGQLPQESWFALGRLLTTAGGPPVLLSWSGSMFEYLMPMLVMPDYDDTLLAQTCQAAVARQIAYGRQRSLPWGVSESGYNFLDANLNYQYHAFGVPGLGLKRGLGEDLVVAPYASALALMVDPEAACANLERLADLGMEGRFGFYEAIDYTPARLVRGRSSVIVSSFMAHHQGMNLLALGHLLVDRPMQRRFEAEPSFKAALLLLQERMPKPSALAGQLAHASDAGAPANVRQEYSWVTFGPQTQTPEVQLLSNGRYHVMVTNAGGGYSRWKDLAVTRWREDTTRDDWGTFLYLRDVESGEFWSVTHQPTQRTAEIYEATFSEGRAEYRRQDLGYESHCEVVVSPEDDIELRRLRITNRSRASRTIEVTSYAEVVLAPPAADLIQTAFGNLFVQTEIVAPRHAILCTRRPRSANDEIPWMFHTVASRGGDVTDVSYETDRMRFIGRGCTVAAPQALSEADALSGTAGSVLDPIAAIRCRITLEPGQSTIVDFISGAAPTRAQAMTLVDKYQDRHLADRVIDLAFTHCCVMLRQLNASESDAQLYRRLTGAILYASAALRADPGVIAQNRRGQSGLWGYGISGDLPIVLLTIADAAQIDLARQLIQCHAYWRLKGLAVDLVILNEDRIGYRQQLQDEIIGLIATGPEAHVGDRPGGIFVRSAEQVSHEDRVLLQAVARVVINDSRGSFAEQVNRRSLVDRRLALLAPARSSRPPSRRGAQRTAAGPDTRQRSRRLHPGWTGICDHHHAGAADAESVGERAGQRGFRHGGLREQPRLYVE
jgi:cyclic beta-1,2-glucan synthetase